MSNNPHPDRPIAVPKRRLNRTTSTSSIGSNSSQGASSPLAGFSFTSAPSNPPKPAANFNAGFGSPSIAGFSANTNTNTGFQTGFGAPVNPTTTTPATSTISGFGGFSGFGTNPTPMSSFGSANVSTPSTNPNPAFQSGFGSPAASNPFAGFQMNAPQPQANIVEIDTSREMDSDSNENKVVTTNVFSSFGSKDNAPTGFSFGSTTQSEEAKKPPVFSGFTFSTPSKDDKPSSFAGFGTTTTTEAEKSDKPAPSFSFGSTAATTTNTFGSNPARSEDKPSTFTGFGNPVTTSVPIPSSPSPFAGFGSKPTEDKSTEKPADKPSPFAGFGSKPTESSSADKPSPFAGFGTKPSESASSDKPSPFAGFGAKSTEDKSADKTTEKPSPFAGFGAKPTEDKSTSKAAENPSPFAGFGTKTTDDKTTEKTADKPSPFAGFGATKSSEDTEAKKAFTGFGATQGGFTFGTPAKSTTDDQPEESNKETETTSAEKPSPFAGFGTKNTSTEQPKSGLSATASPFKPSTNINFGTFGQSKGSSEKEDTTSSDKPPPIQFNTNTSSPFTMNKPTSESDKSSSEKDTTTESTQPVFTSFKPTTSEETSKTISFGLPSTSTTDKPTTSSFAFNAPPSSGFTMNTTSNKRRELDRDEDEDESPRAKIGSKGSKPFSSLPPSSNTPFSFGTPGTTGTPATTSFKFNLPTTENKDTSSDKDTDKGKEKSDSSNKPFTFSFPTSGSTEEKDKTASKSFTFGTSSSSSEKKDTTTKPFTFGAPITPETTTEKKSVSFSIPATTESSTEKQSFSFGTPPPLETKSDTENVSKEATKPTLSFGSSTPKEKEDADTSGKGSKSIGKSPLSKMASFGSTDSATKDTDKSDASKKNLFSLSTPKVTETPGSSNLAFSKAGNKEAAILNVSAAEKDTASSEKTVQTTLKSTITDAAQITYKTSYWELPDNARSELDLLYQFISEQTDKKEQIDEAINSYFGPRLDELNEKTLSMDNDAIILKERLDVQSESLNDLIQQNKIQRLNAVSASSVQRKDLKDWRTRGSANNWEYFEKTIDSMENRLRQFTIATESIKDAVDNFQNNTLPSPASIGEIINNQHAMYLSLAGRVAELDQETSRVKRRRVN